MNTSRRAATATAMARTRMSKRMLQALVLAAVLAMGLALAGCGSSTADAGTAPPGNAKVNGVAMPSSISVVTATHAG